MKPSFSVLSVTLACVALTATSIKADDKDKGKKQPKPEWTLENLGASLSDDSSTSARFISNTGYVAGDAMDTATSFPIATRWSPTSASSHVGAAPNTYAYGVNSLGVLVGVAGVNNESHAMVWTGSQSIDLGTFGGTQSLALGINNKGQVVGQSVEAGDLSASAFLWQKGVMKRLPPPTGFLYAQATGINDEGQIVGNIFDQTGAVARSVRWNEEGKMQILDTLGVDQTYATAINKDGAIVGVAPKLDGTFVAFVTKGKKLVELPSLGGVYSQGNGINGSGDIVGVSTTPVTNENHAVLWKKGVLIDLGSIPAMQAAGLTSNTIANSINDNGDIVGLNFDPQFGQVHAWRLHHRSNDDD